MKSVLRFPPVESADEDGLLALGGDLEPETLLLAYRSGIFPWPWGAEYPLAWFSPPQRGVLFLSDLHVPSRLQRLVKQKRFTTTINHASAMVIRCCAEATNRQRDGATWITPQMVNAYSRLAELGYVLSAEAWEGRQLVGGIYGVAIGRFFAGESMFYLAPNASKVALLGLLDYLRERGVEWIDCQQRTAHMARFGVKEIPRQEFLELLKAAIS